MGPMPGRLLVATTLLLDSNFHRTVILLLEHNEEGSIGVVINRPTEVPVDQALPGWEEAAVEPQVLFSGGPVEPTGVLGVGRDAEGDLGAAELELGPLAVGPVRLFQGYAGWSAGQLVAELEEGAWWVIEAEPSDIFSDDPGELWYEVLGRQKDRRSMFRFWPDDPRSN